MRSYYKIFDTKEETTSLKHARYVCINDGDNIIHEAFLHARQNAHVIGDIRIVRYETKKQWNHDYERWLENIK